MPLMRPLGWRAWYTQGRVYDSRFDSWPELPKEGVLAIVVFFDTKDSAGEHYKEILNGRRRYFRSIGSSGAEFYKASLWTEKKITNTYAARPECVKEGIWDDDETMEAVLAEALAAKFDDGDRLL